MVIPTYAFPALINLLIASRMNPNIYQMLLTTLCVTLTSYAVYWYNDYSDAEFDRIKEGEGETDRSKRPYTSGRITKNQFLAFILLTASAGLLIAYYINIYVFTIQLVYLFLGLIYSAEPFKLKKRLIGKQFVVMAGAVLSCLSGAMVVGTVLPANMYSMIINAIIYATAPTLGDIRDIVGDRKIGAKTLPVIYGPKFAVRYAISGFVAVILAGLVGYYGVGFNVALPVLTTISMGAWIFTVYPIIRRWEDSVYVEKIVFKRVIPSNLFIQIIPLIGLLAI
ncbi:MAG: UbiA family prenyltransferase [Candidatus Bathyarchaeota archaeon]|jgi:4-hydroxybenzoate polyprenyltransferase|nr:UbiA family prenyltransferase [Candidatus Bathyarchaeota archaeon]